MAGNYVAETKIRIYDYRFKSWTMTSGGMVRRWQRQWVRDWKLESIRLTPTGSSGLLKASYRDRHVRHTPATSTHRLTNTAPYALAVFKGTGGRGRKIYPERARALAVGRSGGGPVFMRAWVYGQRANNAPNKALRNIMRRKGNDAPGVVTMNMP